MSLKHILFDLGGVLVRTANQEPRTRLEKALRLAPGEASELVFGGESSKAVQMGLITSEDHWNGIGDRLGISSADLDSFRTQFFSADRVDPELLAYSDRLRSAYTVGLLSNASANLRKLLDQTYHLTAHFDYITISAEEGVMKPDPRIFQIALARAHVEPEETVFVDDMIENVEGARRLGITAIQFLNTRDVHIELASLTGID